MFQHVNQSILYLVISFLGFYIIVQEGFILSVVYTGLSYIFALISSGIFSIITWIQSKRKPKRKKRTKTKR